MLFVHSQKENKSAMKQILLLIAIVFVMSECRLSKSLLRNGIQIMNEVLQEPQLKIYPNPCINRKLTVELNNDELTEIRITNITGKVVLFRKYVIPVNKIELALDNTPDGIYLVQIKTSEQKILAHKLIVSGN